MTSSVNFRVTVRSGVRKKFFTSCCVMVLPPCTRSERAVRVAERVQLVLDIAARDAQAHVQLERPRVDARGQREAPPLELALHADIEVERKRAQREGAEQD